MNNTAISQWLRLEPLPWTGSRAPHSSAWRQSDRLTAVVAKCRGSRGSLGGAVPPKGTRSGPSMQLRSQGARAFRKLCINCVSGVRVFVKSDIFGPMLLINDRWPSWFFDTWPAKLSGHITYATTVTSVRPLRTLETPLLQAGFSHRFLHKNRSSARQFRRSVKQHEATTQASWLIDTLTIKNDLIQ